MGSNMRATGGMPGMELPDYINQPSKPEPHQSASQTDRKLYSLALLFLGLLFIIQATLNVALRISSFSRDEVILPNNTCPTEKTPVKNDCENKSCNKLQEEFNALTRDNDLLENRISLLNNEIKSTEEERDRLKNMLLVLQNSCPAGWIFLQSKCYFVSQDLQTWDGSRQHCLSQEADLLVVNSREEQVSLIPMIQNDGPFWIGLGDRNGFFQWVDGTRLSIAFWKTGQPDQGGTILVREDCVEMDPRSPVVRSWNDAQCSERKRWVCEAKNCNTAINFPIK